MGGVLRDHTLIPNHTEGPCIMQILGLQKPRYETVAVPLLMLRSPTYKTLEVGDRVSNFRESGGPPVLLFVSSLR